MAKMIAVSDELAALLETRRDAAGFPSIEAVAEAAITRGLETIEFEEDHGLPFGDAELKVLLAEADASGPHEIWDAVAVRAEVLGRHAARLKAG